MVRARTIRWRATGRCQTQCNEAVLYGRNSLLNSEKVMPRSARVVLPGQPHHVTHRGNNRCMIFLDNDDHSNCMHLLAEYAPNAGCKIHVYALMGNHIHLLVTPDDADGLEHFMHGFAMTYAKHFNRRYGRTGTLWEQRYASCAVDSDRYFISCSNYIEMNAVRAAIVANPADYRWSSFHCNALGVRDQLVTPHALYENLAKSPERRRERYLALFSNHLDPADLVAIRAATRSRTLLGSEKFRCEAESLLGRSLTRKPRGGDRKSRNALSGVSPD